MGKDNRPMGMDESNGCMAGCGSLLVLLGAFVLTLVTAVDSLGEYKQTGVEPSDDPAVLAIFAVALVLTGFAIFKARKARIT